MPHIIKAVKGGYKVADEKPNPKTGRYTYYSKEPLTKEQAHKQLVAINLSLIKKGESPKKVWSHKK